MRIAFVSPYDFAVPGGVNGHIENLTREFTQRGHSVSILAPTSKPLKELNVPNFTPLGRPVPIPSAGSVARISVSLWRALRARNFFKDGKFDVVHIHEPPSPIVPTLALIFSNAINVGTFHAYREHSYFWPIGKYGTRPFLNRLDGRIAVSKPAAEFANQFFPSSYTIIPNGIEVAHFQTPAPPLPEFRDGKLNLLFVGRKEKRKGLRYLIAAYCRLKPEFPNLRLIVVGPGKLDTPSEQILARHNPQDVVFVGTVGYKDLPRYYQAADVFCAPSTGRESLGIVLLEAMAAGRAIVASNIAGYATVVTSGQNGLLAKPRDDEALAASIRSLLQNPELRAKLGAAGREHAQAYSWSKVSAQVLEFYQQTTERTNQRRAELSSSKQRNTA
ncbi:MAG: glycosyltransferase family 1 protein [Dehalococcoidia bacterium]|nr:glycosyltransferase family 1 protein [Dehalococcoidia bacterium]